MHVPGQARLAGEARRHEGTAESERQAQTPARASRTCRLRDVLSVHRFENDGVQAGLCGEPVATAAGVSQVAEALPCVWGRCVELSRTHRNGRSAAPLLADDNFPRLQGEGGSFQPRHRWSRFLFPLLLLAIPDETPDVEADANLRRGQMRCL